MATLFELVTRRLGLAWKPDLRSTEPRAARAYRCQCGRPVFFRNSQCLACGTQLGYDTGLARVLPLQRPAGVDDAQADVLGPWQFHGSAPQAAQYWRCGNFSSAAGCNWLVPATRDGEHAPLCVACRLNRTIPDLTLDENREAWRRIELAKRQLVSQLLALRLPVVSGVEGAPDADPEKGLVFDFLRPLPDAPVTTGHAGGVITINIEEADDATRERIRAQMHEPYRTLLGHLRHEVGHYYWERLVDDTPWVEPFRALFGDERADYAAALKHHYDNGPAPDWTQRCVSAYASVHPWEDWAETWAHYLHMVDTVDTALSFGIDGEDVDLSAEPFGKDDLWDPGAQGAAEFLSFLNAWVELTAVLNELSRAMGQHDFYPFVLPRPAVAKLQFIHVLVNAAGQDAESAAVEQ